MAYELGQAYVQIMPSARGISGKLSEIMSGEADRAGTSAGSKFSSTFGGALGTLGKVAASAFAVGTSALTAFGVSSVKSGMQFDESMSQVAATMGMTMDELADQTGSVSLAWGTFTGNLREYAQEVGANTAFSAKQASEALNFMALAGYDVQTSMEMLPNVLNLAAAGAMDLGRASDMVTDTQSALGLSIEETNTMVDQMAMTASQSNTSVEQLGDAMLKIGATARNVRGGTQELSTVLGVLADNGIKGVEGGTHLRNILLSLQGAAEDGAAVFGDYAVDIYDAEGNMRSLVDIFGEAQDAIGDLSDEGRNAVLSGMFNKTDLAAVNAILNTSKTRFEELGTAIGDASGAAQQMADTQLDNLAGDVTLFKSALEGVQIAISDTLTPTLRSFVQLGSDGLTRITEQLRSGDISGAASEFGSMLGEGLSKVVENLPSIVDAGGKLLSGLMHGIVDNVDSIADGIAEVAVSIVDFFASNIGTFVSGAIELASGVVTSLIGHLPDILMGLGEGLINGVVAIFETLPEALMDTADAIANLFGGDFDGISEEYEKAVDEIIKQSDSLEKAWENVATKRDELVGNADAEFGYYQSLAKELQGLIDKNGLVKEGEEARVDFITSELSEALGLEKDEILKLAEANDKEADSIDKLLEKKHAEAVLDAEKTAMQEGLKQRQEAAEKLTEVEAKMAEAQQAYADALKSPEAEVRRFSAEYIGLSEETANKVVEDWAKQKSGLLELEQEQTELAETVRGTLQAEAQYQEDYARFMDENYAQIGQTVIDFNNLTAENVDSQLEAAQREYDGKKKIYDETRQLYESGQATDAQMQEASRSLITARNNVSELSRTQEELVLATIKNGQGVVSAVETKTGEAIKVMDYAGAKFGDAGGKFMPEAAREVTNNGYDLVSAVDSQMQRAVNSANGYDGEFNSVGANIPAGIGAGISNGAYLAIGAIESVMNSVMAKAKQVPRVESPSKEGQWIGEMIMRGVGLGVEKEGSYAVSATESAMTDIMDAMDTDRTFALPFADMSVAGLGILAGARNMNAITAENGNGGMNIYITNNIDGAENPEEFASRLCRQIRMEMRMA